MNSLSKRAEIIVPYVMPSQMAVHFKVNNLSLAKINHWE